jgi:hypothetical protein
VTRMTDKDPNTHLEKLLFAAIIDAAMRLARIRHRLGWSKRLHAVSLFELPSHHFESCFKSTLFKHHRFLCLV